MVELTSVKLAWTLKRHIIGETEIDIQILGSGRQWIQILECFQRGQRVVVRGIYGDVGRSQEKWVLDFSDFDDELPVGCELLVECDVEDMWGFHLVVLLSWPGV